MNHLLRELAPVSDLGWQVLDDEARERLSPALAAQRLVDFAGPEGLAALGDEPRPDGPARVRPAGKRCQGSAAASFRLSRCGRTSS
jgi:Encapsulating protein for peroxidase